MSRRRILAALSPVLVVLVVLWALPTWAAEPEPGQASESGSQTAEEREQAEIDRARRVGTGLLWGGVATTGAGGLTFLGLIPTHRNVRVARADLELCMVPTVGDPSPECGGFEDEVTRRLRARAAVATVGSVLVVGGAVLAGVGGWKRRVARRRQLEHDKRHRAEWALVPAVTRRQRGVALVMRF